MLLYIKTNGYIIGQDETFGYILKEFEELSYLFVEVAVRSCGNTSLFLLATRVVSVGKVYHVLDHKINSNYPIITSPGSCHLLPFNGSLEILLTNHPTAFKIIGTVAFRIHQNPKLL